MSKINIFGLSSSGKTCFLYAMAQVLREGVRYGDNLVQIITNKMRQQIILNEGFLCLANLEWPQNTNETDFKDPFDFKVIMRCDGSYMEAIPSLKILDYRGGILEDISHKGEEELNELLISFSGSSAIIFIIDGETLINAMDPLDRDICHRQNVSNAEQLKARMKIGFVENIFMEYKEVEDEIPPIMVAISKGDRFVSKYEKENAVNFIMEKLPSIFSIGSNLWSGITIMSLGDNLGKDSEGKLTGTLKLNSDYNIHIPIIFGLYADLSYQYELTTNADDRKKILAQLSFLTKLMENKVHIFKNGKRAIEV